MHQKAIVLLFLLFNTSFAFDTCYVLFVIDGSSYWPSFRGEITSIATTGNILYSSSAVYTNSNFWLYGDGDQDQPIPNWFYSEKQDFLDNVAEVESDKGQETIVGATAKLNRWEIHNAVIVLYTASPQNLIRIAGSNYTEQYRTLAIHVNDGVDMSPISGYSSPQMSDFENIVELIADVCRQLPTEGPTTSELPTTATSSSSATSSPSTSPYFPTQTTSTQSETPTTMTGTTGETTDTTGTTGTVGSTSTPWEDITATTESFGTTVSRCLA
ncbi:unnamed protein product, partial [Mesorhabditis belari]|uniref:Uncharacterized protein n=1 Tax=Mesorhabditis belari TaxID=2138241 RepID=A0AAF3FP76_9BILA